MKPTKIFFCLFPILLFALLWTISVRKRSETSYILPQYPASPAFKAVTDSHLLPPAPPGLGNAKNLFHGTWFIDGNPKVAMQFYISTQGNVESYRSVYNLAIQAEHNSRLTPTQFATLKTTLRDLPPNAAKPELKDLLIVSFMDGEKQTTRIYNRQQLPASVGKIYQLGGIEKDSDRYPTFRSQPSN